MAATQPTPLIRAADPARDAAACAEIYAPYVTGTAISFEEVPPGADEMAARIRRVTAIHPWLVADGGGRALGFAYADRHGDRAAYRWAADVAVYVALGSHRRGVGRALYTVLLRLLADAGLRRAYAGVTLPNPASVALHEALGFRPIGVYRRAGWKHGAWHDVGWWGLDLGAEIDPPPEPGPPRAP